MYRSGCFFSSDLQAHNTSLCEALWACRSAIFGMEAWCRGKKSRLSTEWKVKFINYWRFKWLNIWEHTLTWIQIRLMIVLSNNETIWNLWNCWGSLLHYNLFRCNQLEPIVTKTTYPWTANIQHWIVLHQSLGHCVSLKSFWIPGAGHSCHWKHVCHGVSY